MSSKFDRVQTRSQAKRGGEPDSHKKAVNNCLEFIYKHTYRIFRTLPEIHAPLKVFFPRSFVLKHQLDWWKYEYDIGCTVGPLPVLIIQAGAIGDDSRHNPGHKSQLIKDNIAKGFIEEYYPNCRYFSINKDDTYYDHHLAKLLWIRSD